MPTQALPPVDPYGATTPLPRATIDGAAPTVATPKPPRAMAVRGLSLNTKIFLAVAGTVGLVLAITLIVGGRSSQKAAQTSLDSGLAQTAALVSELLKAEEENLAAKGRIFFSNPKLRAPIELSGLETPGATPIDSGDYLDVARTMAEETGASWVQIADRNGIRLARSDQQGAAAVDLSESPLIGKALGGETVHGFGVINDSVLFDAISIPIYGAAAGKVLGVAMLVRNIADSTAMRIRMLTGSEVVFFAFDSTDRVRIVGATGRLVDRENTSALLTSLITADQGAARDSSKGRGAMGSMMMSMRMDSVMGSTMAKDNTIDGRTYVWTIKPLLTASENPVGGILALRDKDEALAPFTRMQRAVLTAGAIALALAFLISFGVARQITQPVRALVAAAQRAAEGDYASKIPEAKGEIGALSEAFSHLLEDLREKQALVDFLQSAGGGKTVQAQAQRLGVGAAMDEEARGGRPVMQLQPGQLLANRYEIQRVLGAGGMGMVYTAVDRELGETVAIKTLRPEIMNQDSAALERFRSEIRLARRISHRNVVRTHDIGEEGGLYFITMELVDGSSLKDLIVSRGRLPASAVISIGKQLCRALDVAHEAGVIHRDIKPQNMVVEAGGTLKVMDFGIARLQTRSDGPTQVGMVVGTPEYMSPEQLRGDDLDGRSDIYSAGVALYESLTGVLPHVAATPGSLIGKVLSEIPKPPRASVAEVSPTLSAAIMQALEKDRERRPRTALEFLAILDRA